MRDELSFSIEICQAAGRVAMDFLERGVEAVMKDDDTPVTAADRACERLIREAICRRFPGDAILGEEEGESSPAEGAAGRRWIVDPIDGTYNYARALPIFSTLLALEVDGAIEVGVIHAPAFGDTFWAGKGGGAFKNGRTLAVSAVDSLAASQFNFGAPRRILEEGLWDGFTRLVGSTYRQRGFGDYLGFAFVFEGKSEAMLEVGVKPWDLAPMKIIAEEAGGRFSDLEGGSSIYSGSCLVSNGLVHDRVLDILLGRREGGA